MRIVEVDNTVIEALSAVYPYDDTVAITPVVDVTQEGYILKTTELYSDVRDVNGTQLTSLVLTSPKSLSALAVIDTVEQTENLFFSHLQSTRTGNYLKLDTNNNITFSVELDARCIFEFSFFDELCLRVKFFDGIVYRYLTKDVSQNLFIFDTLYTDSTSANQVFNYLFDTTNNQISLFWNSSGSRRFFGELLGSMRLQAAATTLGSTNIFNTRTFYSLPKTLGFTHTWVSYNSGADVVGSTEVHKSRSIRDVKTNLLSFANHNDIVDGKMPIDFMPLKNQLTQDSDLSRNNPFAEDEVTHRLYHSLNVNGASIVTGYTSGVKRVVLAADQLTYFNYPLLSSPYTLLNVQDSSLVKAGAIAGSTPIESDKVFKKRAADFGYTITNEENGTWLCAWLSAGSPGSTAPVWVDRYYNPNFVNFTTALTAAVDASYVDEFSNIVVDNGKENVLIFDLPSKLVFEPHAVYAYHHLGNVSMKKLIDTKLFALVASGADVFRTADGALSTPITLNEGVEEYVFTGNEFATIPALNIPGSFSITFNVYVEDYQERFANQILGNFNGTGVGFFNEEFVTPFIIIPDGNVIKVFNTDFELVNQHQLKDGHVVKSPQLIAYSGFTPDYWIVDQDNILYNFNTEGLIQTKVTDPNLTGVIIKDIELDDQNNIFLLVSPSISANTVFVYNSQTKQSSLSSIDIATSMLSLSNQKLFVTSASAPSVLTVATQFVNGNEAILDNDDQIWFTTGKSVYKDEGGTFILAVSSLSGTVESLNCDRDGNIWILHSTDKLTKITSTRTELFTTTLTSTPLSGVRRFVDFLSEYTAAGYQETAIVLNVGLSATSNVIKLDFDGNEKDVISVEDISSAATLSGVKTITGFDNLRRYQNNTRAKLTAHLGIPALYGEEPAHHTLTADLSALSFGWHNIALVFNTEEGYATLYIDSVPMDTITFESAKYTFSNVLNQPIQIGSSSGYNNATLFQTLKQADGYLARNIKMKDIRVYDVALSPFDVRNIAFRYSDIRDLRWDIPTGQRSFLDTLERYFKFMVPGRKTSMYNITVENSNITDTTVRDAVEVQIRALITKVAPVHTKLNEIIWRENA